LTGNKVIARGKDEVWVKGKRGKMEFHRGYRTAPFEGRPLTKNRTLNKLEIRQNKDIGKKYGKKGKKRVTHYFVNNA